MAPMSERFSPTLLRTSSFRPLFVQLTFKRRRQLVPPLICLRYVDGICFHQGPRYCFRTTMSCQDTPHYTVFLIFSSYPASIAIVSCFRLLNTHLTIFLSPFRSLSSTGHPHSTVLCSAFNFFSLKTKTIMLNS